MELFWNMLKIYHKQILRIGDSIFKYEIRLCGDTESGGDGGDKVEAII